jgi:hypothetical protein
VGISEDEFWDMLPREFFRRVAAFRRAAQAREETEWNRTLMVVNAIRASTATKKIKPLTLDDLKRAGGERRSGRPTAEEIERDLALLERIDSKRATA